MQTRHALGTLVLLALTLPGSAPASDAPAPQPRPARAMSLPVPDAARGRMLFVTKGCVVCHRVNGTGGEAGPALDAREPAGIFDPLDFAARMWQGAAAMVELQATEFGYQVELSGNDIADLAAFAESYDEQAKFGPDAIPDAMRGWTLDGFFDPLETDPDGGSLLEDKD